MTKTTIYCDHCGKELDTMKDFCDVEINIYHVWFNTDLCSECFEELGKMAKQFCNKEE